MSLNLSVDNYCVNFLSISTDDASDKQIFGDETFFICVQDDEEEVIYLLTELKHLLRNTTRGGR